MESSPEKFWTEDPAVLVTDPRLIPRKELTFVEKLNLFTRWALIVSAILYIMEYEYWFYFLGISVGIILFLFYSRKKETEGFSIVPTYDNPDMHTTSVAPLFAEEWQVYPPSYDLYTNIPAPTTFEEPPNPQSYPYGQYLTRSNLLPSDEYHIHQLNGGPKQARDYVNGAFLRHELSFRDEMTRLYKKRLSRRFAQSCNDTFSPFNSY